MSHCCFLIRSSILILFLFTQCMVLQAQQIAFPGAEGAGRFTTGGRGTTASPTTVFEVTNLTDVNTPGSLRYACSQSAGAYPNRTIVFRVSGTIHLNSRLTIQRNTTIAGQTVPGDGICLADYPVVISGDHVIVRYMRFRMGDKNQLKTSPAGCGIPVAPFTPACAPVDGSGGDDALGNLGNKNIIIDHCSVSWSSDEALTVYRGDSVTMQWNFITEPLNYSYHFETGDTDFERHGYGGIWGSLHGSFHHNLFAHCQSRNPRFGGNSTYPAGSIESADFRNNVIYNWALYTVYGGEGGRYNLVNNYYKFGPNTNSSTRYRIVNVDSSAAYPYAGYYLSGNYVDGSVANTGNNWSGALMASGIAADTVRSKVTVPFLAPYLPANTQSATDAFDSVLAGAGASLPRRDTMDRRIVNDVRFRGGKIIDVQGGYPHGTPYAQTTDAWPVLTSTAAPADTDHDGMPDDWETANSLNPNNAADRQTIASNGYTHLENYLNGITNTSPELYFSGLLNNFTQTSASASAVQSVNLSGVHLTGNIVLTPPAGYGISVDGSNWFTDANPLIITPVGGTVASTTLSIRLNAPAAGVYAGNIIAVTAGAGAFYFRLAGARTGSGNASDTALAVWPLLSNENATATGSITAAPQALGSSLFGTMYNSSFGGISGWQRTATSVPGSLPVGYSPTAYLEYTVTPATGKTFTASSISLGALGGGTGTARMAVYYSLDGFATSAPAGSCTYNGTVYPATTASPVVLLNTSTTPLTGQQMATTPVSINLLSGQTLSVRFFVWITGTGNRYFASQNVQISGITASNIALPLQLRDFSVVPHNGNARLLWITSHEVDMHGYEVERSEDAQHFIYVGTVPAGHTNRYSFTDPGTVGSGMYYRIRMISKDGSVRYSNIVHIRFDQNLQLSVYPNPAGAYTMLRHPAAKKGAVAQVINQQGIVLLNINLNTGSIQSMLPTGRLPAGSYRVVVKDGTGVHSYSFIKL